MFSEAYDCLPGIIVDLHQLGLPKAALNDASLFSFGEQLFLLGKVSIVPERLTPFCTRDETDWQAVFFLELSKSERVLPRYK
jgi:hypothetical protein